MKITKKQLKQIIKEELEVVLTNEEATEMFGETVEQQLEEQQLNEDFDTLVQNLTPENLEMLVNVFKKMGYEIGIPVGGGAAAVMAVRRALGYDKPHGDAGQDMVGDTPVNEEEYDRYRDSEAYEAYRYSRRGYRDAERKRRIKALQIKRAKEKESKERESKENLKDKGK